MINSPNALTGAQKPTVLQLCSYLPNNVFHARCFEAIAERNIDQIVASPHTVSEKYQPQAPTIRSHYGIQKHWSLSRKIFYSWKIRDHERHVNKTENLDHVNVVHAHGLYSDGLLAHKICNRRKLPLVITIRGGDISLFRKYYPHWNSKVRAVVQAAQKVIFVNPNFQEYFEQSHKISLKNAQCTVIPNGVDDLWHEVPISIAPKSNTTRVICVGKLNSRKNQLGLIEALKLARKKSNKHFSLTVVGKPEGKYGESVLHECQKNSWITYAGELAPGELVSQFQQHDLFALVSHVENFGLVYAEALCCGLPIIFSKGQGFDGWSSSMSYGLAVNSKDTQSIAQALIDNDFGMTSPQERKGFSKSLFSWSKIAAEHESIYNAMVYG